MEVWIEPQFGKVDSSKTKKAAFMNDLTYHEIPNAVSNFHKIMNLFSIYLYFKEGTASSKLVVLKKIRKQKGKT